MRVTAAHRTHVSLAALICVKPWQRPRLIYRTHTGRSPGSPQRKGFTEADYAQLLDDAHQLGGPIMLVGLCSAEHNPRSG